MAGRGRHTPDSRKMMPIRPIVLAAVLSLCAACGSGGDDARSAAADSAAALPSAEQATLPPPMDPAAQPDTAWVLRMDGIGPLQVGMTVDEARAAMGGDLRMSENPVSMEDGADRCDHPRSAGLPAGVMMMVEGQRLVRLEVTSGTTPTAEGARIGDTEARIQQLYPGRVTVGPHKYTDGHYLTVRPAAASDTTHLLVFETDGKVVERFRVGQRPQVEYVEGCA
jgi:hypothetical protein